MLATHVSAGLLLVISMAASARETEFTGVWGSASQLCDRDHECTTRELEDPDTHFETCSSGFTIIQTGSRLCGTWDSGCSFGQGSSGVLTGTAADRSAGIKVGESTAFHANRRYPRLDFTRQYMELRRGKLHIFLVDDKGVRRLDQVLEREPGVQPTLEHDQEFLEQCQAGTDFTPA